MPLASYDTVLLNGSVGTGKTTTAERLGDEMKRCGIPGAVIDVDGLRHSWPTTADDPFQTALALTNLQAVASNFRRAGARVLVVATVAETHDELARTATALTSNRMLHLRLTATPEVVLSRLRKRHENDDDALRWHAHRHPELEHVLDRAGFTDALRIDTTDKTAKQVAGEILAHLVS